MTYYIEDIQGIGPAFADKLSAAKITTTSELLDHCCTPAGRKKVSGITGVGEGQILKWTNMADLMRIAGVGPQYSELLEGAGVDTVKELRHRNAANLAVRMEEVNQEKHVSGSSPAEKTIQEWINIAKSIEPGISY
ncbi:MAG: DUF4332 domain-containing protein [Candidatus Krumholzibacteria bacterium]|nr:DUF4332 domain-containing protein [Candidatus Krumholzibacteria bacterium]